MCAQDWYCNPMNIVLSMLKLFVVCYQWLAVSYSGLGILLSPKRDVSSANAYRFATHPVLPVMRHAPTVIRLIREVSLVSGSSAELRSPAYDKLHIPGTPLSTPTLHSQSASTSAHTRQSS